MDLKTTTIATTVTKLKTNQKERLDKSTSFYSIAVITKTNCKISKKKPNPPPPKKNPKKQTNKNKKTTTKNKNKKRNKQTTTTTKKTKHPNPKQTKNRT